MTFTSILLLVGTGLSWAAYDATRKGLAEGTNPAALVAVLCAMQAPFFGAWLAWDGGVAMHEGYAVPAATSVVLNIVANVLFIRSVSIAPLSVSVPLLSLTPVFSAGIAWVLVGEAPTAIQAVGIGIVVAAAIGLNARTAQGVDRRRALRGASLMALVALLWSVTSVVDKMATEASSAAFHGLVQVAGIASGLGLWLAIRRELGTLRATFRRPVLLVGAALAAVSALGLQLLAFTQVLVSLVEAVKRAIGLLSAVAIGRLVFGERLTLTQVMAVLAMAAGTALILLTDG